MTPGQKIVEEAFDAFAEWEHKHSAELEGIELVDRPLVYGYFCRGHDIETAKQLALV